MRLVSSLERSYDVALVSGLGRGDERFSVTFPACDRVLLVTTPTVDELYGRRVGQWLESAGCKVRRVTLSLTEERKTMEAVEEICAQGIEHGLGRRDAIVASGGGVCSDVVGFAASMVRRGIRHIRIPTTLVGQIDAGIGLKCGVNFLNCKNYIGSFHPPAAVYVDPSFLRTLERRQVLQGISEIVKIALVTDADLFQLVSDHATHIVRSRFQSPRTIAHQILRRSIELMLRELEGNPYEDQTLQRLVDMGHTFSPTLEEESGFTIAHGEAVAIDMALTCMLGVELGWMPRIDADRVVGLLEYVGLPIWSPLLSVDLCRKALDRATAHRNGDLNLVVPTRIGRARFLVDQGRLTVAMIECVLASLARRTGSGSYRFIVCDTGEPN